MNEDFIFKRIYELERSLKAPILTTKVLLDAQKYNAYMSVLQDLNLMRDYELFKGELKCQEESSAEQ